MDVILLIVGVVVLVKGADLFVEGASAIARLLRISPLVIGLTVVSFGTSAPEAAVSITAAIRGFNDMAFGNIVGSNMMNSLLILGLAAVFLPMRVEESTIKREIPFMLFASALLVGLYFLTKEITRPTGFFFLVLLAVFLYVLVRTSRKNAEPFLVDVPPSIAKPQAFVFLLVGLGGIIAGGHLVTNHAEAIALSLGMSQMLVGLTIVAVGTSLPELITTMVAAVKKESAIALGNIVGSNIFNILFVLGLTSLIRPVRMVADSVYDLSLLLLISAVMLVFAVTGRIFSRYEGAFLLLLYLGYVVYIVMRN